MAWHNCVVNLNSDSTGSFYTGDIVTGTVVLEYTHRKTIERNVNFYFLVNLWFSEYLQSKLS